MPDDKIGGGVDPRVVLAAERTLLAWLRTGISFMGFGFVLARFGLFLRILAAKDPSAKATHFSLWIGTALVLLGIAVNGIAVSEHLRMIRFMRSGQKSLDPRLSPGVIVASLLCALGFAACVYLVWLGQG